MLDTRSLGTFIIRPTLPSAAIAPRSMSTISSIFCFFQGSAYERSLVIKRVVLCSKSATMRKLLARSELPVSVTSTMASASRGGLTSVAPQLNSTCASTPF